MSKNTITVASLSARMDARDALIDARFDRLFALIEASPLVTTKASEPKGKKGKKGKAAKAEGPTVKFSDLRAALKAHKAAGHIRAGITTKEAIAEGLMREDGTLAKKDPQAKAIVANAKASEPAKTRKSNVTENHVARVAPRDAKGHITPKVEWPLREALAESGKFDRFEIDKKVRKAVKQNAL